MPRIFFRQLIHGFKRAVYYLARGYVDSGLRPVAVKAVAEENLRGLEAFPLREHGLERFGVCVRIDSELRRVKGAQHLGHARRRRIRVFVGVELDDVRGFRLLAWHIRVDPAQLIEKRLVHEKAPLLSVLLMSLVYHDKVEKSREVCEIGESVL